MDFKTYSRTFLHFHSVEIPKLLADVLRKKSNITIADLGAGDGSLLVGLKLKGYLKNAKKVIAVDLSEERCSRLKQIKGLSVICSDVTSIAKLKSNTVDLIICTQVIEHVDQSALLQEIKRLLKPNGILYIASIVKKSYGWWYYKNAQGRWAMDPTHLREYSSKEEFESVLTGSGYKIIQTELSSLKLSVIEFILRRVIVPIFKPKNANAYFLSYRFLDTLRKSINIYPLGYFIIEVIANVENKKKLDP
jgi:2-polyprenyl-3-methyl-5-hydroxy-6-metoxy-1,4-benzoquinol methylase